MKRSIIILFTALMPLLSLLADSYHDTFAVFMDSTDAINAKAFAPVFAMQAERRFPDQPQKTDSVVNEYIESQLTSDAIDFFEPFYRKHVSEQELAELIASHSDPRHVQLTQKSKEIMRTWNQSALYLGFKNQLEKAVNDIKSNKVPTDLQMPENVSPEYIEAFNRFFEASGFSDMVAKMQVSALQMLTIQLTMSGEENTLGIVESLTGFYQRNIRTVLLSLYSQNFTLEDLTFMTQEVQSDAFQHSSEAMKEAAGSWGLGVGLSKYFLKWLYANYPMPDEAK